MTDQLLKIASVFRAAQLYAHMAHNVTYGLTFYQDHKAFGDLYATYEGAYDSLIERAIGLGADPDFKEITSDACEMFCESSSDRECAVIAAPAPVRARVAFSTLLSTEKQIRDLIDFALKGQSEGTKNFLQGLADDSEKRSYKLKQRLK